MDRVKVIDALLMWIEALGGEPTEEDAKSIVSALQKLYVTYGGEIPPEFMRMIPEDVGLWITAVMYYALNPEPPEPPEPGEEIPTMFVSIKRTSGQSGRIYVFYWRKYNNTIMPEYLVLDGMSGTTGDITAITDSTMYVYPDGASKAVTVTPIEGSTVMMTGIGTISDMTRQMSAVYIYPEGRDFAQFEVSLGDA